MIETRHAKTIHADKQTVWDVISDIKCYPMWNPFVKSCKTTFEVGSPIKMRVYVLPWFAMPQRETILAYVEGEMVDYGFKLPLNMLHSSRKHILTAVDGETTKYESIHVLGGWLSPLVKLTLGRQLRRGFGDMADGIAVRAEELADKKRR